MSASPRTLATLAVLVAAGLWGCKPEAPGAPLSFVVVPGDTQLVLSWEAPATNGGRLISSYLVRAQPGELEHSVDAMVHGLTLISLTNGTEYSLTVSAVNEIGEGAAASTTAIPAKLPSAPGAVVAVAGVGSATLTWTGPVDEGGSAITEYVITPYAGSSAQAPQRVPAPATGAAVTGLNRGTGYTFSVAAINGVGTGASTLSNAVTTPDFAGAPTGVSGVRGNAQVQASWTAPSGNGGSAITGYRLTPYVGATAGTPVTVSALPTAAAVTGLTNGTAYTLRVAAVNAVGVGPDSSASSPVTPATVPGAPLQVVARAGNGQAVVRWQAPGNGGDPITQYTVKLSPGGATATTAATTLVFPGLTNGNSYTFTVVAANSVGSGPFSGPSSTVIPGIAPIDCAAALLQNPGAQSGLFAIEVLGLPLNVYCDMSADGGGWTLVYKLSAGVPGDAWALWLSDDPVNEDDDTLLTATPGTGHYVNRVVTDDWNANGVSWTESRVVLYSGGSESAFLRFGITGTNRNNWYDFAHLTHSTWSDLVTGTDNVAGYYFSVPGDWTSKRNWFINEDYGTCDADIGWVVVTTGGQACNWEKNHGAPMRFLYAPGTVRTNWNDASLADVFAVFVR